MGLGVMHDARDYIGAARFLSMVVSSLEPPTLAAPPLPARLDGQDATAKTAQRLIPSNAAMMPRWNSDQSKPSAIAR
jgi:hypothetical protein